MPNEEFLQESIEKMFMDLDTDKKKGELTGIINKIGEHIVALQQSGMEIDEHQQLFLTLLK